jgi:hypothetical protein
MGALLGMSYFGNGSASSLKHSGDFRISNVQVARLSCGTTGVQTRVVRSDSRSLYWTCAWDGDGSFAWHRIDLNATRHTAPKPLVLENAWQPS